MMAILIIRPDRAIMKVVVTVLLALMLTGVVMAFSAVSARAVTGLENGTINTIYQVPQSPSGAYAGYPSAVVCDSGNNLYFALTAPTARSVVMRKDAVTGEVTRYAGSFDAAVPGGGDGGPAPDANILNVMSLAFDSDDNLYIADHGNHKVRVVSGSTHLISTYAGNGSAVVSGDGGPATSAGLNYVLSVSLDEADNLFIGDFGRIRRVDRNTKKIATVAGTSSVSTSHGPFPVGSPTASSLSPQLEGMGLDSSGNLIFGSSSQWVVRRIDSGFTALSVLAGGGPGNWGSIPEDAPATSAFLQYPDSVAVDGEDNVYIGLRQMNCIRVVNHETGLIRTVAGKPGTARGFSGDGGPAKNSELAMPYDMCLDSDGNMYIADSLNYRIRKISGSCPLPVISLVTAEAGEGGVALEWTAEPSTGCMEVEGCVVMRDGAGIAELGGDVSAYVDQAPGGCAEFCYAVKALGGGESSLSNERCVSVPDTVPPAVPANVTATAVSGTEIVLGWDASSDACDGNAAGYAVHMSDGTTVETAGTSISVAGLAPCGEYCFSVSAYDSSGNYSGWCETVCADTPWIIACEPPKGHGAARHNIGSAIPVKFTITDNGRSEIGSLAVLLYRVEKDGTMTPVDPGTVGSKKGKFKYKGKGVWMVILKTTLLEPGEYLLSAQAVPGSNAACPNVVLDPAPGYGFTMFAPGNKN